MKALIIIKIYLALVIANGLNIPSKENKNDKLFALRMETISSILKKVLLNKQNDQVWNELIQKGIFFEKKSRHKSNSIFDHQNLNEKRGHIW